jgi:phage repressor protein C with HTH and peptisase S24 domain
MKSDRKRRTKPAVEQPPLNDTLETGGPTDFVPSGTPLEPTSHAAFADRLRLIISEMGSISLLAKDMSISDSTIRQWLRGSEPSRTALVVLAETAAVSLSWLLEGEGPMRPDELLEGYILFGGEAAEGFGLINADFLALKRDWARNLPGHPEPEALCLLSVEDDAMAPTIDRGDLVVANILDKEARDGIYIVALPQRRPGPLVVRRIGRLPDGSIRMFCDNPKYAALDAASPEINPSSAIIFARVIWSGGVL